MNILRRTSTRRLLIAILAIVAIATASVAAFARDSGPKPPPRSLAAALHQASIAHPMQGVTARVQFSDHLLLSGSLGSGSPLIAGATGRIWAGDGKLRLELQSSAGDTEIGYDGSTLTLYDVASETAYRMAVPQHGHHADAKQHGATPSVADINAELAQLAQHLNLSGAIPGNIAGQPSYTVRVSSKQNAGLLGSVQLAWDAVHGVPLRFAIYSKTNSSPVLSLTATDISFGKVPASDLAVPLAPTTKVVNVQMPSPRQVGSSHKKHQAEITGTAAVARAVPFRLNAPASVIGMPRQSVRLVGLAGSKAAVVVYRRGLGAVVVLEQAAPTTAERSPLAALPTVSIDGVSAHELDTALGTLIQFDRGGVRYTVVGSVSQGAAQQAARTIG